MSCTHCGQLMQDHAPDGRCLSATGSSYCSTEGQSDAEPTGGDLGRSTEAQPGDVVIPCYSDSDVTQAVVEFLEEHEVRYEVVRHNITDPS